MQTARILDQFDFHATLAATPGVSVVYFTAQGCTSCRRWRQLLGDYRATHPEINLFEIDAGRDMALTREFEVFHLPALFVFRDGEFHASLHSVAQPAAFAAALAAALTDSAREAP
jgi:thiol-disulfide isomerase/thioredoxin